MGICSVFIHLCLTAGLRCQCRFCRMPARPLVLERSACPPSSEEGRDRTEVPHRPTHSRAVLGGPGSSGQRSHPWPPPCPCERSERGSLSTSGVQRAFWFRSTCRSGDRLDRQNKERATDMETSNTILSTSSHPHKRKSFHGYNLRYYSLCMPWRKRTTRDVF